MGISRKFAGISRKFADIFFNNFKTNISNICGHGPRISKTCLSIFFPRNKFPESMVPRLIRERGCGCHNWAKSFIAFFLFYRSFCFPSHFFEPKWSIAFFCGIWVSQEHIHIYIYTYIHIYTYALVSSSAEIVIFERCMLRQYQSIHFDLLDFFKKRLVVMVNECAHIVKDGNMWPAGKSLRNLLRFTRRHCLQLFLLFFNKKFFSVQSSKKSYLKLQLSLDISFLVTLEFHQFDDKLYYVVLRTSLSFQGLPM